MLQVGVVSLGCAKNRVDSERMMGILTREGYAITNQPAQAEVLIVNTCGFITPAKEESIRNILDMAAYKQSGKCRVLVVTGCLSERYRDELIAEMPEVDIMIGVSEYETLPRLLAAAGAKAPPPESAAGCALRAGRLLSTPAHSAYLRIADGCDNRCSFCAIPMIRGRYRSEPFDALIDEAKALVAGGVQELIVIAQDVTRYGTDRDGKRRLPDLLRALAETDAKWIRLLYTYPDDIDDALLDAMMASEKILKYIDIPLQHVDDDLLRRMNRRGKRADLCALIEKIRARDPRFVLRTSYIAGFPGETDAQFDSLLRFVDSHPFDRAGVFVYSPEDGTPAADFPDQIDPAVAEKRRDLLMQAQQAVSKRLLAARAGQECEAVVEGYDKKSGFAIARSYGEAPDIDGVVLIQDGLALPLGSFVRVRIDRALDYDLIASRV